MWSLFRELLPLPAFVGEKSFLWRLLPLMFEKGIFIPATANQSLTLKGGIKSQPVALLERKHHSLAHVHVFSPVTEPSRDLLV